jgi:hypothetical protein
VTTVLRRPSFNRPATMRQRVQLDALLSSRYYFTHCTHQQHVIRLCVYSSSASVQRTCGPMCLSYFLFLFSRLYVIIEKRPVFIVSCPRYIMHSTEHTCEQLYLPSFVFTSLCPGHILHVQGKNHPNHFL